MKLLPIAILFFFSSAVFAQEAPKIKVEGQATVSAIPERMTFRIPVEAQALEYRDCVSKLTSVYNNLESALEKAGFKKSSLKNSGLSVNERYAYTNQRRVKDGYSGNMSIELEIAFSDRSMNDIIEVLSSHDFDFGFSLSYKLSEKQRKELSSMALKEAVSDAKMKAQNMAEAIGKDLGDVILVDNISEQSRHSPIRYDSMMKAESSTVQDVSLNPSEIEINQSVIVYYLIGN